jgi:5-methylcytosine-specific restriction endonuclease McrA
VEADRELAYNRTEGDPVKKSRLKKKLYEENEGRCQRCGSSFEPGALTMHRVDTSFNWDKSKGFGYSHGNVRLFCNICHQTVEEAIRLGLDPDM